MATVHVARSGGAATKIGGDWIGPLTLSANTAGTTTDGIDKRGMALGSVRVPNGSAVTSITWYAGYSADDTPVPAEDEDSVAITQTVAADQMHAVPSALAGFPFIYPVVDDATDPTLYFYFQR